MQTALFSSLMIRHAGGDADFPMQFQQIKKRIKTPDLRNSVSGIKELDVSTKYVGDS